jgi:hypothetical protein
VLTPFSVHWTYPALIGICWFSLYSIRQVVHLRCLGVMGMERMRNDSGMGKDSRVGNDQVIGRKGWRCNLLYLLDIVH